MADTYLSEITVSNFSLNDEAEKIFLSHQSWFFLEDQGLKYSICKEIAQYFQIDFTDVRICGSAHIGVSPHKKTEFQVGVSDLDVAIINSHLFSKYIQIAKANSSDLIDASAFPKDAKTNNSLKDKFCRYAAIGYFRPDLMPHCPQRTAWRKFFNEVSRKYKSFSNINAGLYLSESLYIDKQLTSIKLLRDNGIKKI